MDHQSLVNVLGILRLIKAGGNVKTSQLISQWAGSPKPTSSQILKVAAYVIEQIEEAETLVDNSQLADEAKEGIKQSLNALKATFHLTNLEVQPSNTLRDIPGSIANFVILLSAMDLEIRPQAPEDATNLASEIENLIGSFDDESLDPIVRDIAKRHLQTLATLLRHIPIFGLEPALAAYFELITRLRRADSSTTEKSKSALDPLFEQINTWGKRLKSMDDAWNSGARWVGRAGKAAVGLLTYLGGAQ